MNGESGLTPSVCRARRSSYGRQRRHGAVIGAVVGMPGGTHGIAISHATGEGYTDDGNAGEVVAFDLQTLKVVKRIKAESDADGIVFDSSSGHVFVIDGDSGKITVIDPRTDAVLATVDGGGGLEFGVAGENGKFYVDGAEKHEVVRIDTASNVADAHWPMSTCVKPHGLAIDRVHHRLFASCSNEVMVVMNADSGAVIATLPIGEGTDFASFDAVRNLAFSSNRDCRPRRALLHLSYSCAPPCGPAMLVTNDPEPILGKGSSIWRFPLDAIFGEDRTHRPIGLKFAQRCVDLREEFSIGLTHAKRIRSSD